MRRSPAGQQMLKKRHQPYLWLALAAVLAISFLPMWRLSPGTVFAQNEQGQEPSGEPDTDPIPATPEPECTFFTNYPQYLALGPEALQRVGIPDAAAYRHMTDVSAETAEVARALAPVSGARPASFPVPWVSRIDYYIFSTLQQKGIAPAPLTTDAEFLRRVTIDLTGRIPTLDQVQQFVADTDPQKRSKAIDRLLDSPEWVDRWTMWLGDLLKNNSASAQINRGTPGRDALYQFIKESVQYNKPYNRFVTELLTGNGDSYVSGPAEFILGGTMSM
ncbi:MAG TPA: DUF1549 domain-containing protein, partial [Polyangiaceae bacterium]